MSKAKVTITLELDEDEAAELLAFGASVMGKGNERAGIVAAVRHVAEIRSKEWERRHLSGLSTEGRAVMTRAAEISAGIAGGAVQGAIYGAESNGANQS